MSSFTLSFSKMYKFLISQFQIKESDRMSPTCTNYMNMYVCFIVFRHSYTCLHACGRTTLQCHIPWDTINLALQVSDFYLSVLNARRFSNKYQFQSFFI